MEMYFLDWANLLLRWLHVITAIAWIGSSFYFVFLDNNLIKPTSQDLLDKGVGGAMWAVHGGGFYNPQKYMNAPAKIHTKLHWFYWESYSTWLSGFALFTVLYLWNAGTFLVDKSLFNWSPEAAIAGALGFLVVFWLVYDSICRFFTGKPHSEKSIAACLIIVIGFAAWLACQLFAGRAAFLLVGAMIATAMSANVFFWIIPGQRKMVAAMTSGEPYDAQAMAIHGIRGKQRSVHNTYLTLPVLFAMLSNHYSFLYSVEHNWVVLFVMMLAGALIRQFFVQRHGWLLGRAANPWPFAAVGVVLIIVMIVILKPASVTNESMNSASVNVEPVTLAQVQSVVNKHCLICHGELVQQKNVRLDSVALIEKHAQNMYQQVVVTKLMPLGNPTNMTDEERDIIRRWFEEKNK